MSSCSITDRIGVMFLAILLAPAALARAEDKPKDTPKITFQDNIQPIFRESCFNCHNPDTKKAGLDLTSMTAIQAGSSDGKVAKPGDAENSLLYRVLAHKEEPYMPKGGSKLSDAQLATIKAWIDNGMLENSSSVASAQPAASPLAIGKSAIGRPSGPPPMPNASLSKDLIVHSPHNGPVLSLAASPWAPLVAVGSQQQILLYNSDSLQLLGVLPFPDGLPVVLKFSRNGSLLLAAGGIGAKQGKVVIYNVADGKRIAEVGSEYDEVLAADISPDQTLIALGGPSKILKVFSTKNPSQPLYTIKKHTDWVTAIAFSPDGKYLASGDRGGNLYVFETTNGGEMYTLHGHKEQITQVAFRDDGNVLASASIDTVKLWDVRAGGEAIKTIAGNGGGSLDLAIDHAGQLATVGRDRGVKIFTPDGGADKGPTAPFPDITLHTAFTHDDKRVIAADYSGQIRVFDLSSGNPAGQLFENPTAADLAPPATRPATRPATNPTPEPRAK